MNYTFHSLHKTEMLGINDKSFHKRGTGDRSVSGRALTRPLVIQSEPRDSSIKSSLGLLNISISSIEQYTPREMGETNRLCASRFKQDKACWGHAINLSCLLQCNSHSLGIAILLAIAQSEGEKVLF